MARPRIEVQHCVLSATARRYGPGMRTFDLLGVEYWYTYPPDTDFPRTRKFDLFTRLVARRAGPTEVAVRVWWLHSPRGRTLQNDFRPTQPIPFPTNKIVIANQSFRLIDVRLDGPGLYGVQLWCRTSRQGWQGRRWVQVAVEYFRVTRIP